uniref:Uncharacterized protein n=1 Tax=viral metagenome TaxID=1070528 RepID=A0A6C0AG30_9ZZZZ|tara:strand:+ start:31305 stop:31976 length:672 start_codon:yes stop_codon:yes gene_type:complete
MSDWGFYDNLKSDSETDTVNNYKNVPFWVLLEPIDFQINWKNTAGKRPIQTKKERRYYEKIWLKQTKILLANQNSLNSINIYSNPYSKLCVRSFNKYGQYGVQVPCYRISNEIYSFFGIIKKNIKYAEYLIIIKTPIYQYSKWYRYNDIKKLYRNIVKTQLSSNFEYANSSWYILNNRLKLFRCLNIDYLNNKCYLIERVLHDILFELNDFIKIKHFILNSIK